MLLAATATGSLLVSLLVLPALSPVTAAPGDGPRIAFTDDRDEIRASRIDDGEVEVLNQLSFARPAEDQPVEHQGEPSVQPNSSQREVNRVAFVSTLRADAPEGDVYTGTVDRSSRSVEDPHQLTCGNDAVETHPVVSPDGTKVAWAADIGDDDWDIFVATYKEPEPVPTTAPPTTAPPTSEPPVINALPAEPSGPSTCANSADWLIHQATSDPGQDLWPAWDPSGDKLVFSSTRHDPLGDLYLMDVTKPKPESGVERLTYGRGADTQPSVRELGGGDLVAFTSTRFRPDGSIAFIELSARETEADQYADSAFADPPPIQSTEPAWAGGDPLSIAFTSTNLDPHGDVWTAQVRRSGDEVLVDTESMVVVGQPGTAESHPAWHDDYGYFDDSAVLYYTSRSSQGDIGDVRAVGGDRRTVVHRTLGDGKLPFQFDEAGPDYSPDGSRIAFSSDVPDEPGSARQLMMADADGGNVVPVDTDRVDGDVEIDPAWSPDGTKIAYTRYRIKVSDPVELGRLDAEAEYVGPEVVVIPAVGGRPRSVSTSPDLRPVYDDAPDWSPDSDEIVLSRRREPQVIINLREPTAAPPIARELWLVPAQGGSAGTPLVREMTDDEANEANEAECYPDDEQEGAENGAEEELCLTPLEGRSPSWSSDDKIAYVDRAAIRYIDLTKAVDRESGERLVTAEPVTGFRGVLQEGTAMPSRAKISVAEDPAWSPDGTQIAFSGQPAGQPDQRGIYTIAPTGSAKSLRTVADDRGPETEPAWSPDRTADVGVLVTITGSPAKPGDPVTATYTVTNNGPAPARDVVLTSTFTPGGTSTATGPAGCTADGTGCSFGTLAPTQTREYVVTLTYPSALEGVVDGKLATSSPESNVINNEDSEPFSIRSLDVSVELTLDGPTGWVGGLRLATVTVANTGPATAEGVVLQLVYPPEILEPDSPQVCLEGTTPCVIGRLTPGVQTFTVPLKMSAEGTGPIKATVTTTSADSVPPNNVDEVTIEVLQPTIRLLPAVARLGTVTMAYGEKMPPGARVKLGWLPGITPHTGPFKVAEDGTMRAPLVLLRHDRLGPREIIATSVPRNQANPLAEFGPVRGPMLVVPRLASPPDFLTRG